MLKLFTQIRLRRRSTRQHDHQNPNFIPNAHLDNQPHFADTGVTKHRDTQTTSLGNTPSTDHEEEFFYASEFHLASSSSSSREIKQASFSSGVAREDEEEDDASTIHTDGNALEVTSVGKNRMEVPPDDDCCPICFGTFGVPCRGPCGHWYCGGCILQYWNYTAALQPCSCPMCSQKITKLTPEASLSQQKDANVIEVLRTVRKYNRLFLGGPYGMILE